MFIYATVHTKKQNYICTYMHTKKEKPTRLFFLFDWRKEQDLNLRCREAHTLSKRAH